MAGSAGDRCGSPDAEQELGAGWPGWVGFLLGTFILGMTVRGLLSETAVRDCQDSALLSSAVMFHFFQAPSLLAMQIHTPKPLISLP